MCLKQFIIYVAFHDNSFVIIDFYLNDILGVAFRSLRSNVLYPMICSTAAQSAMRVTLSISHPVSLKLLALQALSSDPATVRELVSVPGLRKYLSNYWWLVGKWLFAVHKLIITKCINYSQTI